MNLHKDTGDSLEPCKHMESMLNRTADGTAPPLMRWYARSHARGCNRCGNFLARITALLSQLRDMKSEEIASSEDEKLSQEQWESIESKWAEADRGSR
jgi:hypothetical protein